MIFFLSRSGADGESSKMTFKNKFGSEKFIWKQKKYFQIDFSENWGKMKLCNMQTILAKLGGKIETAMAICKRLIR